MITEDAFVDIVALHGQGYSTFFITRPGMHRNTVKKFIAGLRCPIVRPQQAGPLHHSAVLVDHPELARPGRLSDQY